MKDQASFKIYFQEHSRIQRRCKFHVLDTNHGPLFLLLYCSRISMRGSHYVNQTTVSKEVWIFESMVDEESTVMRETSV